MRCLTLLFLVLSATAIHAERCDQHMPTAEANFWAEKSFLFQRRSARIFSNNPQIYNAAEASAMDSPSKMGDEILRYFRDRLGFQLGEDTKLPPLAQIIAHFAEERAQLLATGRYAAADLLVPARTFENSDGFHYVATRVEEILPDSRSHHGGVSGREYKRALMAGYQILGFADVPTAFSEQAPFTVHDIVHLIVATLYPSYTRSLLQTLREVERDAGWQVLGSADWSERFVDTVERGEVLRPGAWEKIRDRIDIPLSKNPDTQVYNFYDMYRYLTVNGLLGNWSPGKSPAQSLEYLRSHFNELVLSFGGTAADPGVKYGAGGGGIIQIELTEALQAQKQDPGNYAYLASLYTLLANLRDYTPEAWAREALAPKVDATSRFHRIFCQSRFWEMAGNLKKHKAYCL